MHGVATPHLGAIGGAMPRPSTSKRSSPMGEGGWDVRTHSWVAPLLVVTLVLLGALPYVLPIGRNAPGPGSVEGGNGAPPGASTLRSFAAPSATWQSYPVPAGFPVLDNSALAGDPVDKSLVMFGGCGSMPCTNVTNDTWSESNGLWTELQPTLSPPPRGEAQMAWDPEDGYVLLFGGEGCVNPPVCSQIGPLNDTWAFKNGAWNPVISSGPAPPPSAQGGLAYDPSEHDMVLFGGSACDTQCATW